MKRAKIVLTNGEILYVRILGDNITEWVADVTSRGVTTTENHVPYHSIMHISIKTVTEGEAELDGEVEPEAEYENNETGA